MQQINIYYELRLMEIQRNWELANLISIDKLTNRYRTYSIRVARPTLFNADYEVIVGWGRINKNEKRKGLRFTQKSKMEKYVSSILKRRIRNGYQLINKTNEFPVTLPISKILLPYPIQASLF